MTKLFSCTKSNLFSIPRVILFQIYLVPSNKVGWSTRCLLSQHPLIQLVDQKLSSRWLWFDCLEVQWISISNCFWKHFQESKSSLLLLSAMPMRLVIVSEVPTSRFVIMLVFNHNICRFISDSNVFGSMVTSWLLLSLKAFSFFKSWNESLSIVAISFASRSKSRSSSKPLKCFPLMNFTLHILASYLTSFGNFSATFSSKKSVPPAAIIWKIFTSSSKSSTIVKSPVSTISFMAQTFKFFISSKSQLTWFALSAEH